MSDRPWKPQKRAWTFRKRAARLLEQGENKLYGAKIQDKIAWPSYKDIMEQGTCPDAAVAEFLRLMTSEDLSRTLARQVLEASERWERQGPDGTQEKLVDIRCKAYDHIGPGMTAKIGLKLLAFGFDESEFAEILESLKKRINEDGSVMCDANSAGDGKRRIPDGFVLLFFCEYRMHYGSGAPGPDGGPSELEELITRMGAHLMRCVERSRPIGWKISGDAESASDLGASAICLEAVMLAGAVTPEAGRRLLNAVLKLLGRTMKSSSATTTEVVGPRSTTFYYNTYYHVTRMVCTAADLGYCRPGTADRALRRILRRIHMWYFSKRVARRGTTQQPSNSVTKLAQDMTTVKIIIDVLWEKRTADRYRAWRFSKWSPPRCEPDAVTRRGFIARAWSWCKDNPIGPICALLVIGGSFVGLLANAVVTIISLVGTLITLICAFFVGSRRKSGSAKKDE